MINHGYLIHHGILGQKWGVRRYQNADGSYTEAGKKRYSQGVYNPKEANEYANYLNKQGKYAHRYTTSSGPWSLPKHHVEEYTGDPNNLKDRKNQDKMIEDAKKRYYDSNGRLTEEGAKSEYWKNKRNKMFNRRSELENKYNQDHRKEYEDVNNAVDKALGSDDEKKWNNYYKKFDKFEMAKSQSIGKALVEEFGDADVNNFIDHYTDAGKTKINGTDTIERYVQRFINEYDVYF